MMNWRAQFRGGMRDDLLVAWRFRLFRTALAWRGSRDLADDMPEDFLIDERTPELIHEAGEIVDRVRLGVASLPILHRDW